MTLTVSQNGWSVDPPLTTITVADRSARVRAGDAALLLEWAAQRWDATVEPLLTLSGWRSAAVNVASGGIPTSNHLSGTALDLNGGRHPYEATHHTIWIPTITGAKRDAVHAIIAASGGVLRWGGDYQSPWRDEMHIEVVGTAAQVAAVVDRLGLRGGRPAAGQSGANVSTATASTTPITRRPLMFVLIQAQRGYWLVGPGHAHQLTGEEWNESVGRLRDAGVIGQIVFEDGPVGQRRFDLARAACTQQTAY